jgi:hypothetical protein
MSDSEPETEYELESFEIAGRNFEITTIAYLPIELLMANREKQTEISGQKLWCGSLGVIQHILNNPSLVADHTVVEVGAGTGVLGMICKITGASTVILTDHDTISINHMVADCARNQIDAQVKRLDWYKPEFSEWGLQSTCAASKGLVLVAGDVLYKELLINPFFDTVIKLLQQHANSKLMLCHIPRAGVDHAQIRAKAAEMKLNIEEIPVDQWNTGDCFQYCDPDDLSRARLYVLTL